MDNNIKYKDFVEGNCPFAGCAHNVNGECTNGGPFFLSERMIDIMEYSEIKGTFNCFAQDVPPNMCEYCGSELETVEENMGEFHGTPAYETRKICKNGCRE